MGMVNVLLDVPPELILTILEALSYKDLSSCKLVSRLFTLYKVGAPILRLCNQVCRGLRDIIESSNSLLYKLEVAVAGLEDNPNHRLNGPTKRPILHKYQEAWSKIASLCARQSNSIVLPIEEGPAWELAGGVLGQSIGQSRLRFDQFGSKLRGIPRRRGEIEVGFNLRDFTMDPGQDLIVALREPVNQHP